MNEINRRQHHRFKLSETVVMNPEGACEIREMGPGGFSFKCLYDHDLSDEWTVDILGNNGVYLQQFVVEKVWESVEESNKDTHLVGLAVGVRFKDLSPEQQVTLDHLVFLNEKQF